VAAPLLLGSPVFLPVVAAFTGGTAIGADAASGHLRYLLIRPVARHRLYLTKLAATGAFCLVLTAMLVALGTLAAFVLPHTGSLHALALRPDRTVAALGAAGFLARTAAAAAYLALWLAALASLALLAGMVTGSATAGVGLAIGYHLAATVLTQISALRPLQPALLPYWLGRWTSLAQTSPHWATLAAGAACSAAYLTVSTLTGLTIMARKDITS
jgi:ABC-2 type transport system permease protein